MTKRIIHIVLLTLLAITTFVFVFISFTSSEPILIVTEIAILSFFIFILCLFDLIVYFIFTPWIREKNNGFPEIQKCKNYRRYCLIWYCVILTLCIFSILLYRVLKNLIRNFNPYEWLIIFPIFFSLASIYAFIKTIFKFIKYTVLIKQNENSNSFNNSPQSKDSILSIVSSIITIISFILYILGL